MAQQSAEAAVNNNKLYFWFAIFDHLIKRSFISRGGGAQYQKVYV